MAGVVQPSLASGSIFLLGTVLSEHSGRGSDRAGRSPARKGHSEA